MKLILTTLAVLTLGLVAFAQDFAVDQKAMIISGTVEYDRFAGDSYTYEDYYTGDKDEEPLTVISFSPALDYFVAHNVFLGGTIRYASMSQGEYGVSTLGIGPEVGYAIGKPESKVFPFGKISFLYESTTYDDEDETEKETGSDISIAIGIIFPVREHIGISPQLSYHMLSSKGDWDDAETMKDNQISLGVGISGLIH